VARRPAEGNLAAEELVDLATVSPDLLCAVRPDGTFVAVNPAWERVLGWRAEELVGRSFGDFLGDVDRSRTFRVWREHVLAGPGVTDFDNVWPHRDGTHRWISWSATLASGRGLVYCSGRDISERMEKSVKLAHDAALLSEAERAAGVGVWDWQVHLDHAYLSDGLSRILGVEPGVEFSFVQLMEMTIPEDRDRLERTVRRAVAVGEPFDIEYEMRRADGQRIVVWERGQPVLRDGRTVRMYGTVKDITEHRRIEEGLRRAAETEQAAAEQLRQLDRLKTSFLSAVSHELRTPLAVAQGMAETLQRMRGNLTDEARVRVEDALVNHTRRLTELLTNLLDIDRLMRGSVKVIAEQLDAVELLRAVIAASPAAERVELHAPAELPAHIDRLQTERIVANLLDNAAKYAEQGPLSLTARQLEGGGLRIEVADLGPGLGGGELARIFEPFYRTDDEHPKPGTGVGLALVAEFASLHGGRAWAEPREPQGLIVIVELPDVN
jgi:PAS domain S-box-containing protein